MASRIHSHSACFTTSARATVCCFCTQSPPVSISPASFAVCSARVPATQRKQRQYEASKHHITNKMPWRDLIFTDAGVVYPDSWSKSKHDRDDSVATVPMALTGATSFADTPTRGPSGRIASQDLFSRRDSAPKLPAAPSPHRTDERAALPAKTSPCTAFLTQVHQAPLLPCSSLACSERQPQKGFRSPLATREARSGKSSRVGLDWSRRRSSLHISEHGGAN